MGIDISDTLYRRTDIRLSTRLCLEELAKLAQPDGTVRVAYSYLAYRMNVCKRTAFRAIAKIGEAGGLLTKTVRRRMGTAFHEINVYKFTCKFRRPRAHPFNSDTFAKMSSIPNNPEEERKTARALREEIDHLKRGMRFKTPGTDLYQADEEALARLEALLAAAPSDPEA
jgi:hypothetical protein